LNVLNFLTLIQPTVHRGGNEERDAKSWQKRCLPRPRDHHESKKKGEEEERNLHLSPDSLKISINSILYKVTTSYTTNKELTS
jgi:hypothetical protein